MEKNNIKSDTVNESELQKVYIYHIYPRDSIITTKRGFVNIDDGSMGGTHWTCFYMTDNKSFYLDSFGGQRGKLFPNQLPKPIICHNYKTQDKNLRLCGSYYLYFFRLIEIMDYYDAISKMFFGSKNIFRMMYLAKVQELLKIKWIQTSVYNNHT